MHLTRRLPASPLGGTDVRHLAYDVHYAHDPDLGPDGTDIQTRTSTTDGVTTVVVLTRPGRKRTDLPWTQITAQGAAA